MMKYEKLIEQLKVNPRTWLVTGVAGFIGSNLLETLLRLDQNVVGLDNFSTGTRHNLELVKQSLGEDRWANFRFIEGDIRSLETCHAACQSVDIVLHQAALGSITRSLEDPILTNENNVSGFLNMLVAARDAEVSRFVYAASSSVYGDDPRLPKVEAQIGRPLSPYALTKHINEMYAEVFARSYGLDSIGLRYFNVFGPRQNPAGAYAAVIPKWIAAMLRNETIYINGDGRTARDFCYISNAVQANLLAATVEDQPALNQVYNVALNAQTSLNELFEMMRELLAPHYPWVHAMHPVYQDFRPGDMRFSQADISKARRLLGYRPTFRVKEGLEQAIDWYIKNLTDPSDRRAPKREPLIGQHKVHEHVDLHELHQTTPRREHETSIVS